MTRKEIIERMGWLQSASHVMSDVLDRIEKIVRAAERKARDQALAHEAAAELRRLHEENAELLEALKLAQSIIGHPEDAHSKLISAAIAKAEEPKP